MSAARSVTATYMAQYQLTLAITAGVPGGLGNITGGTNGTFYDEGTVLNLTAATPVADGAGQDWPSATMRGGAAPSARHDHPAPGPPEPGQASNVDRVVAEALAPEPA